MIYTDCALLIRYWSTPLSWAAVSVARHIASEENYEARVIADAIIEITKRSEDEEAYHASVTLAAALWASQLEGVTSMAAVANLVVHLKRHKECERVLQRVDALTENKEKLPGTPLKLPNSLYRPPYEEVSVHPIELQGVFSSRLVGGDDIPQDYISMMQAACEFISARQIRFA